MVSLGNVSPSAFCPLFRRKISNLRVDRQRRSHGSGRDEVPQGRLDRQYVLHPLPVYLSFPANKPPATSDAIYRSHPRSYDVFIDLSCSPCAVLSSSPNAETQPLTYTFADLPLYRSLLLLSTSPPSVHTTSTGLWMLAFELLERVWRLCVGVCEYAIGRGRVGDIRIGEDEGQVSGEEDARLLRDMEEPDGFDGGEEDEAVRKGRLILRQFQHNSYHLHARLREVTKGDLTGRLTEAQLRELCGTRWNMFGGKVGSTAEGRLWSHLARVWGMTSEDGNA